MTSSAQRAVRVFAGASVALVFVLLPHPSRADEPAPELMARLAASATHIEAMRTRVNYTIDGRLESLDGEGQTDSVKELLARVDADGKNTKLVVLKYVEDGEDKTSEGQKTARDTAEKRRDPKRQIHMPTLAEQQPRYEFDQVEVDKADPTRVRITFKPKVAADDTVEGSGWVDTRTGTVVSAGFKLSRPPMFIDYVHFTVEFAAPTPIGPLVSKVNVEGKGGLWFLFRQHFRAEAKLSAFRVVP